MLQIIQGATSDALAEVVLQWPDSPVELHGKRLRAKGPYCRWAKTLPTNFDFVSSQPGVWRTKIVDPCCWSPEYPGMYRLDLPPDMAPTLVEPREFALRRFGVRNRRLFWNGKRCVLRGAIDASWTHDYRDLQLGHICQGFDAAQALQASHDGVWLGLRLDARDAWQSQLTAASRYAAMTLVILPTETRTERSELMACAPNLLKVAEIADATTQAAPDWCDAILVSEIGLTRNGDRIAQFNRPILAHAAQGNAGPAQETRRQCEQLQARLAPAWSLDGYFA